MFLGGKNVKISDFGEKKPSDFGEDLFFFGDHLLFVGKFVISAKTFFFFFFFGDHLLLVGKSVISAKKSLRMSAKIFFFGDHLLTVGKFVISARKSLRISAKTFAPLILILPPPPISRSWRRPCPPIEKSCVRHWH